MGKDKKRIQSNRNRKLKRTAARKKQRKQQTRSSKSSAFSALGASRREVSEAPFYAAYVSDRLFTRGIGHAILARQLADARIVFGVVLLDVFCLGVKDAFLSVSAPSEFDQLIQERFSHEELRSVSDAHVRKLIDGAIAYATNLGLEPHPDFRDVEPLLTEIDASACQEEFEYGKDGRPYFISGPYISPIRARQIVNLLQERLGVGNFDFLVDTPFGNEEAEHGWIEEYEEDSDEPE